MSVGEEQPIDPDPPVDPPAATRWFGPNPDCNCCSVTCSLSGTGSDSVGGDVELTWTTTGANAAVLTDEFGNVISTALSGTSVLVEGGACLLYTLIASNQDTSSTCTWQSECVNTCDDCPGGDVWYGTQYVVTDIPDVVEQIYSDGVFTFREVVTGLAQLNGTYRLTASVGRPCGGNVFFEGDPVSRQIFRNGVLIGTATHDIYEVAIARTLFGVSIFAFDSGISVGSPGSVIDECVSANYEVFFKLPSVFAPEILIAGNINAEQIFV